MAVPGSEGAGRGRRTRGVASCGERKDKKENQSKLKNTKTKMKEETNTLEGTNS